MATPVGAVQGMSMHPLAQALSLARRAVVGISRQPAVVVPSIFFPLFFTALNAAAFERATGLPGFPYEGSFLNFLLPAAVLQGVVFGSISAGTEMATDIENGFFDRLLSSPVSRVSVVVGRLAGAATLGGLQAVFFMAVLFPFGARVHGGVASALVLVAVAMLLGVAIGGFAVAMAIRTGSAEAVQGSFPLLFVLLFTSSVFFPRQLMSGWYQTMAGANPISWMVEALRDLIYHGFALGPAITALGAATAIGVVSVTLALLALRARLRAD
jgi:ABC-2 type transport system permease protein